MSNNRGGDDEDDDARAHFRRNRIPSPVRRDDRLRHALRAVVNITEGELAPEPEERYGAQAARRRPNELEHGPLFDQRLDVLRRERERRQARGRRRSPGPPPPPNIVPQPADARGGAQVPNNEQQQKHINQLIDEGRVPEVQLARFGESPPRDEQRYINQLIEEGRLAELNLAIFGESPPRDNRRYIDQLIDERRVDELQLELFGVSPPRDDRRRYIDQLIDERRVDELHLDLFGESPPNNDRADVQDDAPDVDAERQQAPEGPLNNPAVDFPDPELMRLIADLRADPAIHRPELRCNPRLGSRTPGEADNFAPRLGDIVVRLRPLADGSSVQYYTFDIRQTAPLQAGDRIVRFQYDNSTDAREKRTCAELHMCIGYQGGPDPRFLYFGKATDTPLGFDGE